MQPVKFEDPDDDLDSVSSLQPLPKKRRNDALGAGLEDLNNMALWDDAYYEPDPQQGFALHEAVDDGEPVLKYENSDNYEIENDDDQDEDPAVNGTPMPEEDFILYPSTGVWKDHSIEKLALTKEEELDRQSFRKYLKGEIALIPGVGGFDSASDDQKRMRNQKKDPSVMHQMEVESRLVTTSEEVTDLSFNHMRSGDVYDEPSIDEDAVSSTSISP
jgi:hypothetical protein